MKYTTQDGVLVDIYKTSMSAVVLGVNKAMTIGIPGSVTSIGENAFSRTAAV